MSRVRQPGAGRRSPSMRSDPLRLCRTVGCAPVGGATAVPSCGVWSAGRDEGACPAVAAGPPYVVPGDRAAQTVAHDADRAVPGAGVDLVHRPARQLGRGAGAAGRRRAVERFQVVPAVPGERTAQQAAVRRPSGCRGSRAAEETGRRRFGSRVGRRVRRCAHRRGRRPGAPVVVSRVCGVSGGAWVFGEAGVFGAAGAFARGGAKGPGAREEALKGRSVCVRRGSRIRARRP